MIMGQFLTEAFVIRKESLEIPNYEVWDRSPIRSCLKSLHLGPVPRTRTHTHISTHVHAHALTHVRIHYNMGCGDGGGRGGVKNDYFRMVVIVFE